MRILANYGVKTNGDSHTVTFETTGDVPAEKAPATADELFRLAKEAIQRQVAEVKSASSDSPTHEESGTPSHLPAANGNGAGNGSPERRDPSIFASAKQIRLLKSLSRETGMWVGGIDQMTKVEASRRINELMALKA